MGLRGRRRPRGGPHPRRRLAIALRWTWASRAAGGVAAGIVLASGCSGADRAITPTTVGRERIQVVVEAPDGTRCTLCTWLADTSTERQRGLMGVSALDGVDGMVFRYDTDTAGRFWMRATPLALDIAFYDAAGRHVGGASMTPCPDEATDAECPRHGADAPYRVAVEVAAGRAAELGMVPGSRITLGGPCVAAGGGDASSAPARRAGATLSG